jgi:hypothetical protein
MFDKTSPLKNLHKRIKSKAKKTMLTGLKPNIPGPKNVCVTSVFFMIYETAKHARALSTPTGIHFKYLFGLIELFSIKALSNGYLLTLY